MCVTAETEKTRFSLIFRSYRPNGRDWRLVLLQTDTPHQDLSNRRCLVVLSPSVRRQSSVKVGRRYLANLRPDWPEICTAARYKLLLSKSKSASNGLQRYAVEKSLIAVDVGYFRIASAAATRRRRHVPGR